MNHEDMSNYEINTAVMKIINPKCVRFCQDLPSTDTACGHSDAGIHLEVADYCNNPADWGKLMEENKISLDWWIDGKEGYCNTWGGKGEAWEKATHPTSPGRAVSICYLKMKEANNG